MDKMNERQHTSVGTDSDEPIRYRPSPWSSAFSLLGGISGMLAIALVIWRGGAITNQVTVNSGRLDRLETVGSSSLQAHIREDDSRVMDLKVSVNDLKDQMRAAIDLKVEVKVLGTKLDNVVKQLEKMETTLAVKLPPAKQQPN